jgi:hypothetical protein
LLTIECALLVIPLARSVPPLAKYGIEAQDGRSEWPAPDGLVDKGDIKLMDGMIELNIALLVIPVVIITTTKLNLP